MPHLASTAWICAYVLSVGATDGEDGSNRKNVAVRPDRTPGQTSGRRAIAYCCTNLPAADLVDQAGG
jgi:hypothetical protein